MNHFTTGLLPDGFRVSLYMISNGFTVTFHKTHPSQKMCSVYKIGIFFCIFAVAFYTLLSSLSTEYKFWPTSECVGEWNGTRAGIEIVAAHFAKSFIADWLHVTLYMVALIAMVLYSDGLILFAAVMLLVDTTVMLVALATLFYLSLSQSTASIICDLPLMSIATRLLMNSSGMLTLSAVAKVIRGIPVLLAIYNPDDKKVHVWRSGPPHRALELRNCARKKDCSTRSQRSVTSLTAADSSVESSSQHESRIASRSSIAASSARDSSTSQAE